MPRTPKVNIKKKNLNENNDFDDDNYTFFRKKNQGRNKGLINKVTWI